MFTYRSSGQLPGNRWTKNSLSYSSKHWDFFCYSGHWIVRIIPNAQFSSAFNPVLF